VFNRRDEFHSRANELEAAARKLQDPEVRRELYDLARQWRYMADGWNNEYGQDDPAQRRARTGSSTRRNWK
jgi:hypothetical protein